MSTEDTHVPDQEPEQPRPGIRERLAEFRGDLARLTPRVWATPALIAVNAAVFVLMALKGVNVLDPSTVHLIAWGANYGPRTTGGEWWRLASAFFLHGGIVHLAFNMVVLWDIGRFVERLVGNASFVLIYLVCGLFGAVASIAWNPSVVSVGASGAVFGLYGVLLGFLARSRHSIPREVLQRLLSSALVFIAYNIIYGFMKTGIDNAAHLGGLAAGFLFGLAVSHPLTREGTRGRFGKALAAAGCGLALLAGSTFILPRSVDFRAELDAMIGLESRVLNVYNEAAAKSLAAKLSDDGFAEVIETDMLPPWREYASHFAKIEGLPAEQQKVAEAVGAYLAAREEAWQMLADGLRGRNDQTIERSMNLQREAVETINSFFQSAGE